MLKARERGDTIVEVIFATAVLALIIVLAVSIMNSGTSQSERAVEGTFVRQGIDSQSELLRFARDAFVMNGAGGQELWTGTNGIKNHRIATPTTFAQLGTDSGACKPDAANKPFWLSTNGNDVIVNSVFTTPATYANPGSGMWIEETPGTDKGYADFYIYACWSSPGGSAVSTTGTVVRLYVPNN